MKSHAYQAIRKRPSGRLERRWFVILRDGRKGIVWAMNKAGVRAKVLSAFSERPVEISKAPAQVNMMIRDAIAGLITEDAYASK